MAKPGTDGLGEFVASQTMGNSGRGGESVDDASDLPLDMLVKAQSAVGIATMVSEAEFTTKLNAIYQRFGATDKNAKGAVQAMLVAYFAVHGTSPETQWAIYPYKMNVQGRDVKPFDVVEIVGLHNLKKFMGRFGGSAIKLYEGSPEFRRKMRERVARAGLSDEEGHLAIDYVGKDGSLDSASMNRRSAVRANLVNRRNAERDVAHERVKRDQSSTLATAVMASSGGGGVDPFS